MEKSNFSALMGKKKTKNVTKMRISKKMTMSALGNLHTQNDDLEFSSAEKRKFWKKIPLETDFEAYWAILKKIDIFGLKKFFFSTKIQKFSWG